MKRLTGFFAWYSLTFLTLLTALLTYNHLSAPRGASGYVRQASNLEITNGSKISFSALPTISFEIKTAVGIEDARPLIINKYLERWGSPFEGMGNFITSVADQYGVDPYLIIAIAQQESNLGKITPPSCHNAWGWGIHSAGTLCFETWEEGITTFTKGIAEKYHAYGLYTPDEIMTKYVPHSPEGAWAKGVNSFLESLNSGNF